MRALLDVNVLIATRAAQRNNFISFDIRFDETKNMTFSSEGSHGYCGVLTRRSSLRNADVTASKVEV